VDQLLLELLRQLEAVADRDQSIYDTAVRESLGDPIFHLFLKPNPGYIVPDDFGMSVDDDRAIKAAMKIYIESALAVAPTIGVDTFHKRLAAFQNDNVSTGKNNCEDFFGWWDPAAFDETGEEVSRRWRSGSC
jgi:hypothetical protein